VEGSSNAFTGVTSQGSISGGVIQQVLGLLQVRGTVEDHHRVALVRGQNGDVLPAQALKGLTVTPRNGRVRMEERFEGRDESTTKERDIRQRVPVRRDETVKGGNNVDGGKGVRAESKGKTEPKELKLVGGQGQGR